MALLSWLQKHKNTAVEARPLGMVGAIRKDANNSAVTTADGQVASLLVDNYDQLRVVGDNAPAVITTFSALSASANTQMGASVDVTRTTNVSLQVTALTSGTIKIKGSNDGSSWDDCQVTDQATGVSFITPLQGFIPRVGGTYQVPSTYRYLGVFAGDTATVGFSGTMVNEKAGNPILPSPMASILSTYTGTPAINTDIFNFDASAWDVLSFQWIATPTTGVFAFQQSNDNVTWINVAWMRNGSLTTVYSTANTGAAPTADIYQVPVVAKFFRLRVITAPTVSTTYVAFGFAGSATVQPTQVLNTVTTTFTQPALVSGSALIGDVAQQYRANAAGASSIASVLSPATPTVGTIKPGTGRLLSFYLNNSSNALRSVKVFNATAPTLGTTTATFEIDIPAGQSVQYKLEGGLGFSTAITYSVTSAKGLTDNTATGLALNDVSGFFSYS